MAFSQTDLDNIDAAMVAFAIEGVVSVTVGNQTVQARSLDELRRLREMVAGDVAADSSHGGMRLRQWVPGGCG